MTPERHQRIGRLFDQALEVAPEHRGAFLDQACPPEAENAGLRGEVETLLANHIDSEEFLSRPALQVAAAQLAGTEPASIEGKQFGHYEIVSMLGAGGMGHVYLATDERLGRQVALKLLPPHLLHDAEHVRRFEQEARATSALNHPNILTVYDVGVHEGTPYLVMELLEGEELRAQLQSGSTANPLPARKAIDYGRQIAAGLAAAHEKGIIHRDLKPENLFVTKDGRVKILDFGLAKLQAPRNASSDEVATQKQITSPGTLMGTVAYMSPEQVRGQELEPRSDIFSFGLILFEMLNGKRAFAGDSQVEVMHAILKDDPPELGETNARMNPALQKIVMRCLEKKPERRFHSAHDLGFALEALTSSSISLLDTGMEFSATAPAKRSKPINRERIAWLMAFALAIFAIAGWGYGWQAGNGRAEQLAFRQLNFRSEAIFQACFAPDGTTVVYSAATDGNTPQIFTVHPEFPAPQPIGARGMHLLAVSSKGELAVLLDAKYIRHRMFSGTLARMPLVGGAPREILEGVRQADWSPDGSELAIIREVEGKDRLEYPIGKVLYEVSGNMSDVRVSPKGDRIAFFEHPQKGDDRGSVNVIGLDGTRTMLTEGYWSERGLAWSPDGKEVLFSASLSGGNYMIFGVTLDGSRRIADQSPGGLILQDVATDGRWLATRIDFRYAAMVHTPATKDDRDLSWLRTSKARALSQDGQTLLFSEDSVDKNYAVCLRKTDGSPLVRLGDGTPMDLSADGKWALAIVPSKPPQLVVYPTGAGETRRLDPANIENYASAQWFRDGRSILIGGNESGRGTRYYVQDIDGGAPRAVTPEGTREGRLSPDGKLILARSSGGKFSVYSIEGGDARTVQGLTDLDVVIQWGADSRFVFAYRGSAIPCRVERVNLDTGRRELFAEMAPANRTGLLTVRPTFITDDQQSYSYTTYQQVSSLFVTENRE